MKRTIVLLALCLPLLMHGQQRGIQWAEDVSWQEVLKKAKEENKYIFLDCYATWCMPCRAMDKNVYPMDTVGNIINEKFISVKVQMDKTEFDDENVKKWYKEAKTIESHYTVNSLPTFLFFSPDGKPLHKAVGFRNTNEFLTEVSNALNPSKQYYRILENYEPGMLDTLELKGLALSFRISGKKLSEQLAVEYFSRVPKSEWGTHDNIIFMTSFPESPEIQHVAFEYLMTQSGRDYLSPDNLLLIRYFNKALLVQDIMLLHLGGVPNNRIKENFPIFSVFKKLPKAKLFADRYIDSLSEKDIYQKEVIQFITDFTKSSKDKGFNLFYEHAKDVDSVMNIMGYARGIVDYIIDFEEVRPYLDSALKYDNGPWTELTKRIKRKYNKGSAERIVLNAKARLYEYYATNQNKYWPEFIKYYILKIERYGTDTTNSFQDATLLNNFVYDAIFFHSNNKREISIGLKWMEGVIRRNPKDGNHMDTYANLLYKAGRKQEAIEWQEKALSIAVEQKQDWCLPSIKGNLAKMKTGKPTWIKDEIN